MESEKSTEGRGEVILSLRDLLILRWSSIAVQRYHFASCFDEGWLPVRNSSFCSVSAALSPHGGVRVDYVQLFAPSIVEDTLLYSIY